MTVCIAAICTWRGEDLEKCFRSAFLIEPEPYIIGISDRMISDEYTQSELPHPKFSKIVNSIMALMAGNVSAQTNVFNRTRSYFLDHFSNDPRTIPIKEVAYRYEKDVCAFLDERRDMIVRRRTGLKNYEDFRKNYQNEDRKEIIKEIKKEPGLETIIAGIDESGPHIYLINHFGISCHDSTGFAIVGSGYFHADSQLMRTRHSTQSSYTETLLLTYMAKKQAELDPYVGKEFTDIFVITDENEYDVLSSETVKMLQETYTAIYNKVLSEAKTKIQDHLFEERKKKIEKKTKT